MRKRVALSARSSVALMGALLVAVLTFIGATSASADTTPSVTLAAPSAITHTSAQLKGTVNPNGGPSSTAWHFEYSPTGEEGTFQQVGPGGELTEAEAEGTSPVAVEEALIGFEAGRTYFIRLVATNEFEQNRAVVSRTFNTESIAPPAVSISAPSAITGTGAHLSGEVNPEGTDSAFAVHWHFQCTRNASGSKVTFRPAPRGSRSKPTPPDSCPGRNTR